MTMLDYQLHSSRRSQALGLVVLLGAIAALTGVFLVFGTPPMQDKSSVITLGAIGCWRYSWQGLHLVRAVLYQTVDFPRRRRSLRAGLEASHIYVVVLSYRMGAEMNAEVYGALLADLRRLGRPATVVACVTDPVDIQVLNAFGETPGVRIVPLIQSELGKRDAMEKGLSLLAQQNPPPGAVVVLMDGDTLLPPGTLEKTVPFLVADATLGALSTDNVPLVNGTPAAREWYRLRMRDRHQLMCSMSLTRRLLVLTGRFSMFRAEIALAPGFIASVAHDGYYHRRVGRVPLLTGDDKSTWFYVLQQGWRMIYVPDVAVYCLEKLPHGGFFPGTVALMHRYFLNMTLSNVRAIKLMPSRIGLFPWLALIDQRISPWSTLWGPLLAIMLTVFQHSMFLIIYLLWVVLTRTAQSWLYNVMRPAFHPLFPFLQFYNQVVGAALKINAAFHPHTQKWTRQQTGTVLATDALASTYIMWLCLAILAMGAMLAAGV